MYYTYVLYSKEGDKFYYGFTEDLKKRLSYHKEGKSRYTKRYSDWILIYYEACLNKKDAKRREEYLKEYNGRRMLKLRLREYLKEINK